MKASSLFLAGLAVATISIAPAGAQNAQKKPVLTSEREAEIKARWYGATNYRDCLAVALEVGWTNDESRYGCNARKFKN
jgi:hypothetical protein